MLELLDTPAEIPFFSDLIHREIVYRLLQCPQGDLLRAIARLDDDRRGTGKALAWLRANYAKPFRLEQLASMARMGTSTFNHRFRAPTSLSPLQYQKQLRLLSARVSTRQQPPSKLASKASLSSPANTNVSSASLQCATFGEFGLPTLHPDCTGLPAALPVSGISRNSLCRRKFKLPGPATIRIG
jgi:AraC-like DNA-binding protein